MKKFLTKAVAALASAVTLSSMAGAIPTSAIDMSYGVGKNSSMRYTVYTTKVKLTVKTLSNPGIQVFTFLVKGGSGFTSNDKDDSYFDYPLNGSYCNYSYNDELKQGYVFYYTVGNPSRKSLEFSIYYDIDPSVKSSQEFKIGVTEYKSVDEPDCSFDYGITDGLKSIDAVVSVSPNEYVRLGDIDNNNTINATDLFYMEKILSDSVGGQLSTTYLDQQLKNRNSTWSKNYPFLKCAAVADIDHNAMIQDADSDSLAKYVAEAGAGATISNKEINTLLPVTVVYDN